MHKRDESDVHNAQSFSQNLRTLVYGSPADRRPHPLAAGVLPSYPATMRMPCLWHYPTSVACCRGPSAGNERVPSGTKSSELGLKLKKGMTTPLRVKSIY